jgi:hypothetical protein
MSKESGRAWIGQVAMEIAKTAGLPIENPTWALDTIGGASLPEPRLCFDLSGKRHSVAFSDAEIDDCAHYESERSIVRHRLKETFRRLKRQTK